MILIKIGGSLITNKKQERSVRHDVLKRLAQEIYAASASDKRLIIGHGSGSFGHFEANKHGTMSGVTSSEQWAGFARVAAAAAELNQIVINTLLDAHVPAFHIQPGATAHAKNGTLVDMDISTLRLALHHHLVPIVYGDAVFDSIRGGTIVSTETIFTYLVQALPVTQILLLGEVNGVLDTTGEVIPHLTPQNISNYQDALGGSEGVDVTGGMLTKVSDMLSLATRFPTCSIRIINGLIPGTLQRALVGEAIGTLITA